MDFNVDNHILRLNFIEFLTSFLEGEVELAMVLQLNERIYQRDHATLSNSLVIVSTKLHNLKEKIDDEQQVDKETILNIVNESVLELLNTKKTVKYK